MTQTKLSGSNANNLYYKFIEEVIRVTIERFAATPVD